MREEVERLVVISGQGMGGMRNEGRGVEAGGGDWTKCLNSRCCTRCENQFLSRHDSAAGDQPTSLHVARTAVSPHNWV